MHHSLQIMFILPLMTGHLFWKAAILGGLYRGVPLYLQHFSVEKMMAELALEIPTVLHFTISIEKNPKSDNTELGPY